jgi:flagellar M-ring protein FliF
LPQLLSLWSALPMQRRIIAVLGAVALLITFATLVRLATAPGMALLYGGLEPGAAGEIVRALEQRSARHEVRGDSIWVESRQRDSLRMTLAAEGLPANSASGYELLDGLSGFGTTSQMFDAAYWRAKEGELARTIVASPHIRAARVHIAHAGGQPFRRELRPTASVTVTTGSGTLNPQQARALKFLVAAAVAGLQPEDVAVIDGTGGLIATAEDSTPSGASEDRASEMKRNVERLLEARVGAGRAVVELSLETVNEREQITERRFDPESRVAISAETEERSSNATDQGRGAVTVASNLPDGDAGDDGQQSQSQSNETRERINYEVSETQRQLLREPGAVRRITVAVLVDGVRDAETGAVTARSEEELGVLRELVASAVGYDEARGDVITLRSLVFEPIAESGTLAETSLLSGLDVMWLAQILVLALVALALGLFVVRPILKSASLPAPDGRAALTAANAEDTRGASARPALTSQATDEAAGAASQTMSVVAPGEGDWSEAEDDPVARLRRLIEERQDETVEILRNWMEEGEERV